MLRRLNFLPAFIVLLLGAFSGPVAGQDSFPQDGENPTEPRITAEDVGRLLRNVEGVGQVGAPGPLCVFGENATTLITGKEGATQAPLVAAAKFRNGRVIAFGHDGYLSPTQFGHPGTGDLLDNILLWLARDDRSAVVAVVGNNALADFIAKKGFPVRKIKNLTEADSETAFGVLVIDAARIPEDQVDRIGGFIADGGGLLTASLGWGWLQVSGKSDLKTEHMGNRLLGPLGIVWTDGSLVAPEQRNGDNFFPVPKEADSLRLLHVEEAFKAIQGRQAGETTLSPQEVAQAVSTVDRGIRGIPETQFQVFESMAPLLERNVIPTGKNKIKKNSMPEDVLAMTLQTEQFLRKPTRSGIPEGGVPALAAANDFPGAVPDDAKTVEKTVEIDLRIPDWHSTGLYAVPGRAITIHLPDEFVDAAGKRNLGVRIGCHSDRLWGAGEWSRYPEITLQMPLKESTTTIASPFGGLVYITVPRNFGKGTAANVRIAGAVEAPLYVHGKTSVEEWKEKIRHAPGPWGELASDRLILATRTENLKELDNPDEVMEFWNKVLDACADLCGRPLERDRPERIVCDRQISAGYMHSGYPVMTWMDVEKTFVNLQTHPKDGWGFFHEFGHNHQSGDWTFEGTGEVTVNLFTLYVFETVCGIERDAARGAYGPEDRKKKRDAFFAKGAPFDEWKRDPFLALIMYIDLIDAFGWNAFKAVFREYRALPGEARPKNDAEKRDQWMVRLSRQVDRNLGPYFDRWGVPVSGTAKDSIKDLPAWDPY